MPVAAGGAIAGLSPRVSLAPMQSAQNLAQTSKKWPGPVCRAWPRRLHRAGKGSNRGTMRTILVTGSAGFIGFHLSQLLLDEGFRVVGYDGMTDYYDVRIKQRRHQML
ncbi:MAG: NAD-dependent epimerase/dehydratase family protein, partial [Erythrobacter sp.]